MNANTIEVNPRAVPDRLEWALKLAARDLGIFLLKPGAKEPMAGVSWLGSMTTDPAVIRGWFAEHPDANYGVHPGDKYVILDPDVKDGKSGLTALAKHLGIADWGLLGNTFAVCTPSGGYHLYFKADRPYANKVKILDRSVDVRGWHGYVVGPGSVLTAGLCKDTDTPGAYTIMNEGACVELPGAVAELLTQAREKDPARGMEPEGGWDKPGSIERARHWLRHRTPAVPDGTGDDYTYRTACWLRDYGVKPETALALLNEDWTDGEPWACNWAGNEAGLHAKIMNAYAYGQNRAGAKDRPVEAVFAEAIKNYQGVEEQEPLVDQEPFDLFGDAAITREPVLTRDMLPAVIGDFAWDAGDRLGADPSMVAIPALAVCAAALDDCFKIQPRELDTTWTESARLWIATVSKAGSMKTPALNTAMAPLRAIEGRWMKEDAAKLARYEEAADDFKAQRKQNATRAAATTIIANGQPAPVHVGGHPAPVRPPSRRLVVNDATMEKLAHILHDNPRGILWYCGELVGLIAGFDAYRSNGLGKDRGAALELFDGGPRQIDRVKVDASVSVPNWSACVLGGIQPRKLRELMDKMKLDDDGFLQRFLLFSGRDLESGADWYPDDAAIGAYSAVVHRLVMLSPIAGPPVTLSQGAQSHRRKVEEIAKALASLPTTPPALQEHLAKWPGMFARLLLTLHAIESMAAADPEAPISLSLEVSAETARKARDLMLRFFLPHAERFYGAFFQDADTDGRRARWIAGYILARKLASLTAREIKRAYAEVRDDEGALGRAMEWLRQARWIGEPEYTRQGSAGAAVWTVNPLVHSRFAKRAEMERVRRDAERLKIVTNAEKLKELKAEIQ